MLPGRSRKHFPGTMESQRTNERFSPIWLENYGGESVICSSRTTGSTECLTRSWILRHNTGSLRQRSSSVSIRKNGLDSRLSRAEEPISGVAESRKDITLGVQFSIERGTVDLNVRMCLG